jgi:hypothetical protein
MLALLTDLEVVKLFVRHSLLVGHVLLHRA